MMRHNYFTNDPRGIYDQKNSIENSDTVTSHISVGNYNDDSIMKRGVKSQTSLKVNRRNKPRKNNINLDELGLNVFPENLYAKENFNRHVPTGMFDWPVVPKLTVKKIGAGEWKPIPINLYFRDGASSSNLGIPKADQNQIDFEFNKFLRDKKVPQIFKDSLVKCYNILDRKIEGSTSTF